MDCRTLIKAFYRKSLLPALRSAVTPVFRSGVNIAGAIGLLGERRASGSDQRQHFTIVHLSNHVGDTVMLLPMIDSLRRAHPTAFIECVVQTPIASFLRLSPSLDRVHEFEIDRSQRVTPWLEIRRTRKIVRFYWKNLREVMPTTCIVPRWGSGFRDLMLAYLLQAPNRIGFASNDFDKSQPPAGYRDALLTCLVRGAQGLTEPARFLYLLQQAGLIEVAEPALVDAAPNESMVHIAGSVDWRELASRIGVDPSARLAIVAPGASAPRRIWPVSRWSTVVQHLHESGFTAVLLAGKHDAEIAQQVYAMVPASRRNQTALVAGATDLTESTCLIAHSQVLVGNDSGPGHIAGALGIPCVILFIAADGADRDGPSAPERVRPMGQQVVCCRPSQAIAPCRDYCTADCAHCILQISTETVQRGINALNANMGRNLAND